MHNEFSHLYQKAAFDFFQTLDPDPTDDYAPDYVFYVRSVMSCYLRRCHGKMMYMTVCDS